MKLLKTDTFTNHGRGALIHPTIHQAGAGQPESREGLKMPANFPRRTISLATIGNISSMLAGKAVDSWIVVLFQGGADGYSYSSCVNNLKTICSIYI
jgi:hypothetical protein